jgi:hypothetical protein
MAWPIHARWPRSPTGCSGGPRAAQKHGSYGTKGFQSRRFSRRPICAGRSFLSLITTFCSLGRCSSVALCAAVGDHHDSRAETGATNFNLFGARPFVKCPLDKLIFMGNCKGLKSGPDTTQKNSASKANEPCRTTTRGAMISSLFLTSLRHRLLADRRAHSRPPC